jgi:hypothetical protein
VEASDSFGNSSNAGRAAPPLVGRDREIADLEAALAQARTGRGRLVLVAGEPGIGKTRLAEAMAERAQSEGMLPLWGRSWETGGAPAFWPWVQILRALIDARGWTGLQTRSGGATRWLAQILPELRDVLIDATPPQSADSEKARFALFDAISSFLQSAAAEGPLVIVLDDLHAADQASLLLFEFVAEMIAEGQILLLGTYQEVAAHQRPEVEKLVGTLSRKSPSLVLQGFGEGDLAQLVEHYAGGPWPEEMVRSLHATTEGNPFFGNEVMRMLGAEGQLGVAKGGQSQAQFPLPDTVKETIHRRFLPLGPRAHEALKTAAVIGREFRLTTLERAAPEQKELIEPLDEAVAAGLLTEVHGSVGLYRFTHNLIRETLYMELSTSEHIRLHRVVGEALEHRYGDAPEHLPELAHHFAEAAPGGDSAKAFDFAIKAAEDAMRLFAYEQAAELFQLALDLSELVEPNPGRTAELLLDHGLAVARYDDLAALDALLAAAEAARAIGDVQLQSRAALSIRAFPHGIGVIDEQPSTVLSEVLELVPDNDPALRARVQARLAASLYYWPGTEQRRQELIDQAIATARRVDDPATLAHVLYNCQLVTWGPDNTERDLTWVDEILHLNQVVDDPQLELTARNRRIDLLVELGELAKADRTLEILELMASKSGADPRTGAYVCLHRARGAIIEGRYPEAERLNAEAAADGKRLRDQTIVSLARIQILSLRWEQERLAEVEKEIRQAASGNAAFAWPAFLAMVCCRLGYDDEAKRELERLDSNGFDDLPRYDGWMIAMAVLSEVCAHFGDVERAAKIYELLLPFADRNVTIGQTVFAGPASRALGILAGASGEWDVAEDHFQASRDAAERMNAPGVRLRTDMAEALMLARRDQTGDRARALELLGDCGTLARKLDLQNVVELVDSRQSELAGQEGEPPVPTKPTKPPQVAPAIAFLRREGDVWAFDVDQQSVRVRDSKGVRCLATLLANPGVEIHAMELAQAGTKGDGEDQARVAAARAELDGATSDDAGPLLDAEAKSAYRRRLDELRAEVDEAESFNDPERAAHAREEMDFLVRELAGAVGLGGRDRKAASSVERARVSVTKAIRATVRRIGEHDPNLGRELEATVRTGTFCIYEPDPRHPLDWQIDAG